MLIVIEIEIESEWNQNKNSFSAWAHLEIENLLNVIQVTDYVNCPFNRKTFSCQWQYPFFFGNNNGINGFIVEIE